MEISRELTFIESTNKILSYNYKLNKACVINNSVYNFLKNNDIINLNKSLTDEEKQLLLKNGVLIDDKLEYDKLAYSNKLAKRKKVIKLTSVYLHITQRCNLSCSYCYNHQNLNQPDKLSLNDILSMANTLKNIGVENIILTGGEALLRKDILEICKIFKDLNFNLGLLTNGTLLSEKQSVLDLIDKAIISIDTFDQTKNMRTGLNVLKLKETLLKISNAQRSKITLRSVITRNDEESWKEVKDFAISNGFNFISSVFVPNNSSELDLIPNIDNVETCETDCSLNGSVCGACYNEIAIDFNGDIYPCQALIKPELKVTNIFNHDWLKDLENSKITSTFMNRSVDNIENCPSCEYKYLCGGGCPAISYNLHHSVIKCASPMCIFSKTNIENYWKSVLKKYFKE
ncbi:radical SAM/SPASM domain-containing protein [Clostridium hydrogenum]|uniref:radical SAM/SPASM domain-containing protein n=1 Tax=Clostridium hydrogenum TaxID=2855764 RepID=UPI001F1DEDEC|nr:radical SAM protein [Clostridium hydrogenum]